MHLIMLELINQQSLLAPLDNLFRLTGEGGCLEGNCHLSTDIHQRMLRCDRGVGGLSERHHAITNGGSNSILGIAHHINQQPQLLRG
jgi:hypothetical protein